MRKRDAFLLFLFIFMAGGFIMIGFYAFVPTAKAGMDYYLGPTALNISNGATNAWLGLTASPMWVTYITPNLLWIGAGAGILGTVFILLPLKDAWTGFWAGRHKVTVPTTTGPAIGIRSSTPPGATTRPKTTVPPVQETTVAPPTEEKKEESETA